MQATIEKLDECVRYFENTGRFAAATSSPGTAARRKTDRLSWRFKAVGFEDLSNGVARSQMT